MVLSAFRVALAGLALLSLTSCSRPSNSSVTRLVDRFQQGSVKGSPAKRTRPQPALHAERPDGVEPGAALDLASAAGRRVATGQSAVGSSGTHRLE